jgi:hypothetical protein
MKFNLCLIKYFITFLFKKCFILLLFFKIFLKMKWFLEIYWLKSNISIFWGFSLSLNLPIIYLIFSCFINAQRTSMTDSHSLMLLWIFIIQCLLSVWALSAKWSHTYDTTCSSLKFFEIFATCIAQCRLFISHY